MNTLFTKNFSKNFLLLKDFPEYSYEHDYKLIMLNNNHIPNSLDFSYDLTNNKPTFKYDITSKQSLYSLFSSTSISYKAYLSIIMSLIELIRFIEEYLLDLNNLIVDSSYIYLDPEKYSTYFTICPAWNKDFYKELNIFLNDLLKRIDHNDDTLVLLAYRLANESSKDGFNVGILKTLVFSSNPSQKFSTKTDYIEDDIHIIADLHSNNEDKSSNSENNSKSIDFFTHFKKNKNNSTLLVENSTKRRGLFTLSRGFIVKSLILLLISVAIISLGLFSYLSNNFSNELSFFVIVIGIAFLFGSSRYILELYPSAKIPLAKNKITSSSIDKARTDIGNDNNNNNNDTGEVVSNGSHILFNNNNNDDNDEFGNTVILKRNNVNHRLVYTGTDYVDNVSINSFPFTIGKIKSSADMIINNPLISRIHACIYEENNSYYIEDLNSANGTYVNGTLLSPHEKSKICEGDTLTFSHLSYIFK